MAGDYYYDRRVVYRETDCAECNQNIVGRVLQVFFRTMKSCVPCCDRKDTRPAWYIQLFQKVLFFCRAGTKFGRCAIAAIATGWPPTAPRRQRRRLAASLSRPPTAPGARRGRRPWASLPPAHDGAGLQPSLTAPGRERRPLWRDHPPHLVGGEGGGFGLPPSSPRARRRRPWAAARPALLTVDRGGRSGAADSGDGDADLLRGKCTGPAGTGAAGLRRCGAAAVAALLGAPPPVRGGGRGLRHPPAPDGGRGSTSRQSRAIHNPRSPNTRLAAVAAVAAVGVRRESGVGNGERGERGGEQDVQKGTGHCWRSGTASRAWWLPLPRPRASAACQSWAWAGAVGRRGGEGEGAWRRRAPGMCTRATAAAVVPPSPPPGPPGTTLHSLPKKRTR